MTAERITSTSLAAMKRRGERIACLTCYDAAFARLLEAAGVEVLLVGDSLGMVLQGQPTTVPVQLEHMVYHSGCVSRTAEWALVIADMPFLSYATEERALRAAERLMGEGGASMVKLEGGAELADTVCRLTRFGAPVCAHLGLLPQSIHQLGGYRYQGKDDAGAARHSASWARSSGTPCSVSISRGHPVRTASRRDPGRCPPSPRPLTPPAPRQRSRWTRRSPG